ncbi:MAG: regulatory iron-sulfur-containing complex subunit RicT [Phycisphaerales bacterium]
MSIFPLKQFEADLAEYERDRRDYDRLEPPKTIVVRFGKMRLIGEFPYSGKAKPGCGSKIVVRTHRGTEIGEMLTSTCPNAGCSKSVTRKEMLDYIENSGGRDYPFHSDGKALRVATIEDMNEQSRIDAGANEMRKTAQAEVVASGLPMKIVEAEPILGGERLTLYFTSEDRIDFRDLVRRLAEVFSTRIDLRQVGARDEARLVADYERCGQHCCCKQFLKVLKPVSMKSAKVQKATLDPLKISGRCGRLMCCLRYEDETYTELQKRLPRMKSRVGTMEGVGIVIDRQILTQLVLVHLEESNNRVAVPVEELMTPEEALEAIAAKKAAAPDPLRGMSEERAERRGRGGRSRRGAQDKQRQRVEGESPEAAGDSAGSGTEDERKKRRRRRRKPRPEGSPETPKQHASDPSQEGGQPGDDSSAGPRKKRRRRRRRKPGGGDGSGSGESRGSDGGGGGGGGD